MEHRWLGFLSIGALGLMVFVFFWFRNQPIEINIPESTIEVGSLTQPTVTFVNPAKGAEEPTITIVEFGDFECGPCQTLVDSLEVVVKTFPDDVQVVWKDMPNESIHELATPAAIAAHCADRQGAFWTYHDALFDRQAYLSESQFTQIAQDLQLDVKKFQTCYNERDTLPIVKKDYEEGLALGLTSTPTLFVGDQTLVGAITTQDLVDLVATMLEGQ
ncbi:MAG TPA: thioredoxin domain-containing protein [Patescibacteria group bacterium]|nr:thioredoxin domain-containing protein [Patescibacteria group bacterium]